MKNAISIDLEDWFCVNSLSSLIKNEDWDKCESRIVDSTLRVLELLDKHKTCATFFVLGWVAERFPELIREISNRKHEIAVHGYNHLLLTGITEAQFEEDLKRALETIQGCGITRPVLGFRAPSFSMVEKTTWALKILEKYKIIYDSSVFPIRYYGDRGIPDAPLGLYKITENLLEVPMSCIELWGKRYPSSGGAYFRILPYVYTRYCVKRCNSMGRPFVFYTHPWELDPGHPKLNAPFFRKFGHYYNLTRTERKLDKLLTDFEFTSIRDLLGL